MATLAGMHHIAFVTNDVDRLVAFYRRVFDAEVTLDMSEEGLRHVFIRVGEATVLHAFQVPGVEAPPGGKPMFERGRLDHFALNAASEEAFWEIRERIVAEGAGDGEVTDMGVILLVTFVDPDGAGHEVVWSKPGVADSEGLPRSDWRTVEPPDAA